MRVEKFFRLRESKTTVGREIIGGLPTFLTMASIIIVNPAILSDAGMDRAALITATCLAAGLGTLLVGLWANVPFAMAPGMGLNAFFTYSLVLGQGLSWQTALGVVFVSGVAFLLLTIIGVREKVVNAIPVELRISAAAGIGLFISFIGLKNMGVIIDDPVTLVAFGKLSTPVLLGGTGLLLISVFEAKRIRGAILLGILLTFGLGIVFGEVPSPGELVSSPPTLTPLLGKLDIAGALQWGLAGVIFSFMFVDLFDSVGTIVACSYEAGYVADDGTIPKIDRMLMADAMATISGAVLGTSTTTTYIEASTGIADGARTGLASVITAICFLAALFFTPLVSAVPSYATAPALVVVGVYMFRIIGDIDFRDFRIAIPAFLTIILMPLTFSIATGLAVGFLTYTLVNTLAGDFRRISPVMWVIGMLAAVNLALTAM